MGLLYSVGRGIFVKGIVERRLWNHCKGAHKSRQTHNADLPLLCVDVDLPVFRQEEVLIRMALLVSL